MDMIEFGKQCRPLNDEYYKKFGVIPSPADYACSREEFLDALKQAIEQNKQIDTIINICNAPSIEKYNY